MTAKELAALLNGRRYGYELDGLDMKAIRDAGLVIAYGASDDLLEFEGAIYEECGAWEDTTVRIYAGEIIEDEYNCRNCRLYKLTMKSAHWVSAVWCKGMYTWFIDTDMPHETFDIIENGELFCRGIVFDVADTYEQNIGLNNGLPCGIDERERINLLKEVRKILGFNEGDALEITVANDQIIIKKHKGCENND